jgi:hypothetical protein
MCIGLSAQVIAQVPVEVKVVDSSEPGNPIITANPGEAVDIYIRLDNVEAYIDPANPTIQAIQFGFTYNSTVLEINTVEAFGTTAGSGDVEPFLEPWPVYFKIVEDGQLDIALAMNPADNRFFDEGWYHEPEVPGPYPPNPSGIDYLTASGKILKISATVPDGAPEDDYPLELSELPDGKGGTLAIINEKEKEPISSEILSGTLHISAPPVIEVAQITATSDDGGVTPIDLGFGTDPSSTEGFDAGLDVAAPPIQPDAKLDAVFEIPPSVQDFSAEAVERLLRDIRPNIDSVTWNLKVQDLHDPPWMGFTLNWVDLDKVMSPEGKEYLSWQLQELDVVTGEPTGDPIDMLATTETHFEASIFGGLRKFTITARAIVIQSLDVAEGWNMASLIGHPINPTVGSVFSPKDIIVETNTFWYDPAIGQYVLIDEFEYTKGYWILALQDATVTTEVTPETEFTINLSEGWNMIGMVGPAGSTIDFTDPNDNPDGSVIGTNTFWYDPAVGQYVLTSTLESGKGYWVLAIQDCTLTVGPATAASPSGVPNLLKPDWIMPLKLSDNQGSTQFLTMGMSDNTSSDIDFRFDLVSPPVSPASKFTAYILADHQRFNHLDKDIKPMSQIGTWDIVVDSPKEGVTLSWNQADLPKGNVVLEIESQTIDMRTENSVRIPAGENTLKLIVDTSPKPREFVLLQNWPNPFNPETWIPYKLPKDTDVVIIIYDVSGHPIRKLDLAHKSAGVYVDKARAAYWDGRNEAGESVASGLYFYTIQAEEFSATRRMLLLK